MGHSCNVSLKPINWSNQRHSAFPPVYETSGTGSGRFDLLSSRHRHRLQPHVSCLNHHTEASNLVIRVTPVLIHFSRVFPYQPSRYWGASMTMDPPLFEMNKHPSPGVRSIRSVFNDRGAAKPKFDEVELCFVMFHGIHGVWIVFLGLFGLLCQ